MKKINKNRKRITEFIRLDKHLQKLTLNSYIFNVRKRLGWPGEGFKTVEDYEEWQIKNIFADKTKYDEWENIIIYATAKIAKLTHKDKNGNLTYKSNVELFIALNFPGGYSEGQPGIPHHRSDLNYIRARKITQLYDSINPNTGKKISAKEVAEAYQPDREKISAKKHDSFIDRYGVGSANAVRKIVSKYKKEISKIS